MLNLPFDFTRHYWTTCSCTKLYFFMIYSHHYSEAPSYFFRFKNIWTTPVTKFFHHSFVRRMWILLTFPPHHEASSIVHTHYICIDKLTNKQQHTVTQNLYGEYMQYNNHILPAEHHHISSICAILISILSLPCLCCVVLCSRALRKNLRPTSQ